MVSSSPRRPIKQQGHGCKAHQAARPWLQGECDLQLEMDRQRRTSAKMTLMMASGWAAALLWGRSSSFIASQMPQHCQNGFGCLSFCPSGGPFSATPRLVTSLGQRMYFTFN
jgi:hypothetical protein